MATFDDLAEGQRRLDASVAQLTSLVLATHQRLDTLHTRLDAAQASANSRLDSLIALLVDHATNTAVHRLAP